MIAGSSFGNRSKAMNSTSGLRLSAIFFTVFWTAGMLLWRGTLQPASVVLTVIGGCVAGYICYRLMRWRLARQTSQASD